jgi:uncharacterized protein YdeI (BOF family)
MTESRNPRKRNTLKEEYMVKYLCAAVLAWALCLSSFAYADDKAPKLNGSKWVGVVRGEVVKIEEDVYIVRDFLDRKLRLHLDKKAYRDGDIKVGDEIEARFLHGPKDIYVKSVKRRPADSPLYSPAVEGEVLKIDGDAYFVKDINGREIRVHADQNTKKDGNITVGDEVLARMDETWSPGHAESLIKR